MKRYMIKECVNHYHEVEIDDELRIEDIIADANKTKRMFDTGYEAIESALKILQIRHGFDYTVKPNACGTDIVEDMEVIDELE